MTDPPPDGVGRGGQTAVERSAADSPGGVATEDAAVPELQSRHSQDLLAQQFRHYAGKISRQASIFLAGTVFTVVAGYLFKIYVSRELGTRGLGIYALGGTTLGLLSIFTCLGLPAAAARFVAIYRGRSDALSIRRLLARSLLILGISGSALGGLLFASRHWIAGKIFKEPELASYLPLFAVLLILSGFQSFLGQYLRGHQEVARRTVIEHFILFPVKVLLTVALFLLGWGLTGYVVAELGSVLVGVVLLAGVSRRLTPLRTAVSPGSLTRARSVRSEELGYAASITGYRILTYLGGRTDLLLIGVFLEADQAGIYSVALTTAAFIPTLLVALNSIFGPMIADLHARQQVDLLHNLFQTSTKWCLGLTLPMVTTIVFFAPELMGLFGPGFEAGAPVLALLALAQLVNVGVGSVGTLLVMSGHQRLEILNTALTAAATLSLNVILIPKWGMLGAATALAVTIAGSNLFRVWLTWRWLGLLPYSRHHWRLAVPLALSASAVVGAWLWVRPGESLPAVLVALMASYTAFVATAAFSLDQSDRIILRAVRDRLRPYRGTPRPAVRDD